MNKHFSVSPRHLRHHRHRIFPILGLLYCIVFICIVNQNTWLHFLKFLLLLKPDKLIYIHNKELIGILCCLLFFYNLGKWWWTWTSEKYLRWNLNNRKCTIERHRVRTPGSLNKHEYGPVGKQYPLHLLALTYGQFSNKIFIGLTINLNTYQLKSVENFMIICPQRSI